MLAVGAPEGTDRAGAAPEEGLVAAGADRPGSAWDKAALITLTRASAPIDTHLVTRVTRRTPSSRRSCAVLCLIGDLAATGSSVTGRR